MLEPEIKYENCEEIYTGPATSNGELAGVMNTGGSNSQVSETDAGALLRQKRNYNELLQPMMVVGGVGEVGGIVDHYVGGNNYQNHTGSMGTNYYGAAQQLPQPTQSPDVVKVKRQRRSETNILFSHPFFHMQADWDNMRTGETVTARCLSCNVILRGHKNVSSNFIKHMKRLHPELYKLYENCKLLKFKGYNMPATLADSNDEFNSQQNTSACVEPSYFDANSFLEHMAAATAEEHNSTEASLTPPTPAYEKESLEFNDVAAADGTSTQARNAVGLRLVSQDKIIGDSKTMTTEVDLSSKTLAQMSHMLDIKLNSFVTKSALEEERKATLALIEKRIEESIKVTTLNEQPNTDDSTLQAQIDALKQECQQLRAATQRAQQGKHQLQRELQSIDRTLRQRKLIIRNVPILNAEEKPKQTAERLFSERLQLPDIAIVNAILLTNGKNNKNNKHMLLIELQKAKDAKTIFSNCFKLKNTGIVVEYELSPFARKRKNKLLVLRKEILRRNAQLKVVVRHTQLLVCGKQFYWDDVDGLCVDGDMAALMSSEQANAVEQLKDITDLDMKEFLNVLKNYDVK